MAFVDVLVGLQWGSEGKGKISSYLAKEYDVMIRSGGPQAGHTFYHDGTRYINRQVPCGVFKNCSLYITSAGIINLKVLEEEIKRYNLKPEQLKIDKNTMVITKKHIKAEIKSSLKKRLASTCEGVGAAQSSKIWRRGILFQDAVKESWLSLYCENVFKKIHAHINNKQSILIEGTQGFGLCLNHGNYPFVTSRDVTSSALLNDSGIAPTDHNKTIGVLRTYPIRVSGNSGPTNSKELSWNEVTQLSGSKTKIQEYTTITKKVRRIFQQDYIILKKAIMANKPDELALTFIDYINAKDFGKTKFNDLSIKSKKYILKLEKNLKLPITLIGTGPYNEHIIDRRIT